MKVSDPYALDLKAKDFTDGEKIQRPEMLPSGVAIAPEDANKLTVGRYLQFETKVLKRQLSKQDEKEEKAAEDKQKEIKRKKKEEDDESREENKELKKELKKEIAEKDDESREENKELEEETAEKEKMAKKKEKKGGKGNKQTEGM